ncbi:MAG TPA: ABC transporter ATP-binding protein [bacterium (Candidatus Stahlbacteria)]|nr:ABC transporter ATP-binding protein [Candidatus Stahlbacteria bacterium]
MNKVILEAKNIHKIYKDEKESLHVLKGIDLKVYNHEIVVILGPSGSGKTTLLHILGGLDRPTNGNVLLDGKNIFSYNDRELALIRNREIGFVFQFHQLLPEFTALENVIMPRLIAGQRADNLAREVLREVGLEGRENHVPARLSGGERQRVAVARALINNPKIILADEPSGNLDASLSEHLHQLIFRLSRERGLTFVVVTHKESLAKIGDRVMRLVDGKLCS